MYYLGYNSGMAVFLFFLMWAVLLVLFGLVEAWPMRLGAVKAWLQQSALKRVLVIIGLAFVTVFMGHILVTRAQVALVLSLRLPDSGNVMISDRAFTVSTLARNRTDVATELWQRQLWPIVGQDRCYTGNSVACRLANSFEREAMSGQRTPASRLQPTLLMLGQLLLPGIVFGLSAWRQTQLPAKKRRKYSVKGIVTPSSRDVPHTQSGWPRGSIGDLSARLGQDVRELMMAGYTDKEIRDMIRKREQQEEDEA